MRKDSLQQDQTVGDGNKQASRKRKESHDCTQPSTQHTHTSNVRGYYSNNRSANVCYNRPSLKKTQSLSLPNRYINNATANPHVHDSAHDTCCKISLFNKLSSEVKIGLATNGDVHILSQETFPSQIGEGEVDREKI
jgi:hypothetical protein